jgi:hypothetical protein
VASLSPATWAAAALPVTSDSLALSSILGTNLYGYISTIIMPTINGTATANSQVVVLEDGIVIGVAGVSSLGSWSFTCSTLTTGVHRLTFEDANQAGSFSAATGLLTIQV